VTCFIKRVAVVGAFVALGLLAVPGAGSAQYYNYRGPRSLVIPYNKGANQLYQYQP
jgi:hypothetical protein